jgi:PHP-associated
MVRVGAGPRAIAALLVLAGLALTMNAAAPAVRARETKAGYQVLAADFHVHSFPGDGLLPPWDLAVEARRRRLDAIALTNHNAMYSWHVAQWLAPIVGRSGGALVIPGEELTSIGFHLAVVGISRPIPWRQSAAAVAAQAHAQGGIAIAAHAGRHSWRFLSDADLRALDGVEVAHPMMHVWSESRRVLLAFYDRATAIHPSIAAIGSTDFHHVAPVGLARTYLLAKAATPAAILDAIRAGRTVACDGLGQAYGPPDLVEMVKDDCRRDASSAPDGQTTLDRLGTWLVWLGVVALVLLPHSS